MPFPPRHAEPVRQLAGALGPDERRASHELFCVLYHGERLAADAAGAQARLAPDSASQRFLRRQAREEHFHSIVFAGAAAMLSPHLKRTAMPAIFLDWQHRIDAALARGQLIETLLVQQVFLEGLGNIVLHRLDLELALAGDRLGRLRKIILYQEDRHHVFGLRALQAELARDPSARPRIDALAFELFGQTGELLHEIRDALAVMDSEPQAYMAELGAQLSDHLPERAAARLSMR